MSDDIQQLEADLCVLQDAKDRLALMLDLASNCDVDPDDVEAARVIYREASGVIASASEHIQTLREAA